MDQRSRAISVAPAILGASGCLLSAADEVRHAISRLSIVPEFAPIVAVLQATEPALKFAEETILLWWRSETRVNQLPVRHV
jgi:hypothetical protein